MTVNDMAMSCYLSRQPHSSGMVEHKGACSLTICLFNYDGVLPWATVASRGITGPHSIVAMSEYGNATEAHEPSLSPWGSP